MNAVHSALAPRADAHADAHARVPGPANLTRPRRRATLPRSVWGLHHNKAVWPDPEKFDPERFNEANSIRNYSFLPFSAGPRGCLGRNFAMNELKTMTAMLLQNFTFTPDETLPEPKIIAEIMLLTQDGLRVKITER